MRDPFKERLSALGAQAALLSGSGATVFGVFDSPESAQAAADQLRQDTRWCVFNVPIGTTDLPHHAILHEASSEALPG